MANRLLSDEFLEEVISKNDIVSVMSKYITVTRRGSNYWACCPFHMEKTPSLSIKEDAGFFKCFGCGESGNVIGFIMKYENVDFLQAVEILCKNAGMQMPTIEQSSEMLERKKKRDKQLEIIRLSCEFYQANLNKPQAFRHNAYINKRGLTNEVVQKFKIGASLDYDSLPAFLKSKGFSYEDMMEAGVVGKNDKGNFYDFYGTRLIFPICNGLGEIVGFSARDISDNPEKAKYKNTPQTLMFNKSALIYGYHFLRELKKNRLLDSIILVEGQMDVIACHQAGITNAVGCLGTAFTPNHAKDLSHLSNNVILCLDGDGAGSTATYKAMTVLRNANMNVTVVRLEGAKDPDEYIKKFGKDKFVDMLANAMNYMEFILIDLAKKYDLTKNTDKNTYINETLKYFSELSTASEQEIYLGVLREIVNVPIDALRKTLTGAKQEDSKTEVKEEVELASNNFINQAKLLILSSLLYKKITNIDDYADLFSENDEFSEIFNYISTNYKENKTINISSLYTIFSISPNSVWDKVINFNFPQDEVFKEYLADSTRRLRIFILKQRKELYKTQLSKISSIEEMYNYMAKIKEIDQLILKL